MLSSRRRDFLSLVDAPAVVRRRVTGRILAPPNVLKFVQVLLRRPRLTLAGTAVLALVSATLSWQLELRTGLAELLPDDDPGVVALKRTQQRMGDLSLMLIGVRSPNREANLRYAAALTEKLRALPPHLSALATYHVRDLLDFFKQNRWLYLSPGDLEAIHERLRREILSRKNPLFIGLDGDGKGESLEQMRQRISQRHDLGGRFPDGYFMDKGGTTVWVAALPPGGLFSERQGEELLRAAEALIAADPPSRYHPEMTATAAGPVMTAIRNRQALERDVTLVVSVCLVLIGLSLGIFFRSFKAVLLIGVPGGLATLFAHAVAYVAFGHLNVVTAFLTAFVLGNGTNYAIVLLCRYQELRSSGLPVREAIEQSIPVLTGSTGVAALASAVGYLSLMITDFRGYFQFGLIGAAGCLSAWLFTFAALPALLQVLERRGVGLRPRRPLHLHRLGRAVEQRAGWVLLLSGAATLVLVFGARHFLRDPFQYDFRKLSSQIQASPEIRSLNREMDALFGRWPQPILAVTDSPEDARQVKAALRRQDAKARVLGDVVTIYDLLPGTPQEQRQKIEVLERIRKLLKDPALEVLEGEERKLVDDLVIPDKLRPLVPADLPPLARRPFMETDGTVGRVVLIYPAEKGISVWWGRDLMRIADVVHQIKLESGKVVETSGSAVIFSGMLRSILRDGPIASLASLSGVVLLLLLRVRPMRAALLVLGGLLTGIIWMIGICGWAEVRISFLNFIALPFIFGVGAEYAVNVLGRFREERSPGAAVSTMGSAVALCSWSAIVGYGSLLAADNRALRGLGAIATVGETACLVAAVLVFPAAITLLLRRPRWRSALHGEMTRKRHSD